MSVYQPAVAERTPRVDTLRRLETRLQPVGRTTLRGTGKLRRRMSPAHQFRLTLRQRAAAAGEPGSWLKDREPEKPRSRTATSRGLVDRVFSYMGGNYSGIAADWG